MIYRLATRILAHTEYSSATVDHFVKGAYDAMIRLETGPTIGIVRSGRRQTLKAFTGHWTEIVRQKAGWPDIVLVLTATVTDWRYTYQVIGAKPGPPAYCACEDQVLKTRRRIWGAPSREEVVTSLPAIVRRMQADQKSSPADQKSSPAGPPNRGPAAISRYPRILVAAHPAVHLRAAEKDLLDIISDWPLVRRKFLPGLAGVSSARISQMLKSLKNEDLVTSLHLRNTICYALSEDGLRYVAYRDRVLPAFDTWSVEGTRPERWYGGQMVRLHKDFNHTDTVNRLVSELAVAARALDRYHLSELDPPTRAAIWSNHNTKRNGIFPDAGGMIRYVTDDGARWIPFLLELERRAITVDRATNKVRLYQNFWASGHKWEPNGPPLALFVFDTRKEELGFFQVAKGLDSDVHRPKRVPFALSHLAQIEATGFLGPTWVVPEEGREDDRAYLRQLNSL